MPSLTHNTPALRFPGYTGVWEQQKLDDLYILAGSGGTPKSTNQQYYNGSIPFLGISDITGRDITKTKKTITEEGLHHSTAWIVPAGAISLAMYASVGEIGILTHDTATSQAFYNMVFDDDRIRDFIYYRLFKAAKQAEYEPLISTGTQRNLNAEKIKNFTVQVTSVEEMGAIGHFFRKLDDLINLHQRQTKKLTELKQGLLQNMFPREGESVPRLRFPGFTDTWKQRKVGDICKINGRIGFRGYTEKDIISKEEGGVLTFSPTNIVDNKLTMDCKNTYITREKYDESPEIMIKNGDILFVKTGSTLGKSALVTGLNEDASINPQIVVMRVEEGTEAFFSNVLITQDILKQVAAVRIGGAVPTMTETELKNFVYYEPTSKVEKTKIGECFNSLDNLINLHERYVTTLRHLKKGLLQKMFPQD